MTSTTACGLRARGLVEGEDVADPGREQHVVRGDRLEVREQRRLLPTGIRQPAVTPTSESMPDWLCSSARPPLPSQ